MPKKTEMKVGFVLVKEVKPGKWRSDWRDPHTKVRVRLILPATTFTEAKEQAQDINLRIASGKGFHVRSRGAVGHPVSDAVLEAVKHTNANERTRGDYLSRFNPFAEYLTKHAPGVTAWQQISEPILENYLEYCRRQSVAPDTIRMRMYVLRMTADYMSRTYPDQYRNVAKNVKIRGLNQSSTSADVKNSILSPLVLRELLAWLRENEPMVYVWGMLQGLCGLRVLEAVYLCEQDLDWTSRTITVTENPAHKPKTRSSYRTIPICGPVEASLREWISQLKVRHPDGFLFAPTREMTGRRNARQQAARVGAYTVDTISHRWTSVLRKARRSGIDVPDGFVARRLRATFITAMRKIKVDIGVLQAYVGHSPNSMLLKHYDYIDVDRMRIVAQAAQELCNGTGFFAEQDNVQDIINAAV